MDKDYDVWNIDEILKAYSNVPDMAKNVKTALESLFIFLEKNSLITSTISDENGNIIKVFIKKSELTSEGLLIGCGPKNPIHRWLGSKSSQKTPPDMKLLEKALLEIRKSNH
ncbi:hypothetical protein ACFQNF_19440 [Iodobacter arcticus]|uniref:Uncharacterized protein n=1 Tax=Iodobacter arcticus TaxID=590593 RepID=A0ABW2R2U0_9NEIS